MVEAYSRFCKPAPHQQGGRRKITIPGARRRIYGAGPPMEGRPITQEKPYPGDGTDFSGTISATPTKKKAVRGFCRMARAGPLFAVRRKFLHRHLCDPNSIAMSDDPSAGDRTPQKLGGAASIGAWINAAICRDIPRPDMDHTMKFVSRQTNKSTVMGGGRATTGGGPEVLFKSHQTCTAIFMEVNDASVPGRLSKPPLRLVPIRAEFVVRGPLVTSKSGKLEFQGTCNQGGTPSTRRRTRSFRPPATSSPLLRPQIRSLASPEEATCSTGGMSNGRNCGMIAMWLDGGSWGPVSGWNFRRRCGHSRVGSSPQRRGTMKTTRLCNFRIGSKCGLG